MTFAAAILSLPLYTTADAMPASCPASTPNPLGIPSYDPSVFSPMPPATPLGINHSPEPEIDATHGGGSNPWPDPPPPETVPVKDTFFVDGGLQITDTGASQYTIPLKLPENRAGFVPRLALRYSSEGGGSIAGVGFNIDGVDVISRCPKNHRVHERRTPVSFTNDDALCLNGAVLRRVSGTQGQAGSVYTRAPDNQSRITAEAGSQTTLQFKLQTRDGLTLYYGGTSDSEREYDGVTESWYLRRVEDRLGNYSSYTYDAVTPDMSSIQIPFVGSLPPAPSIYLSSIEYGGSTVGSLPHDRRIEFHYRSQRPDAVRGWRYGRLHYDDRLLERIDIYAPRRRVEAGTLPIQTQLLSRYHLDYETAGLERLRTIRYCVPGQNPGSEICSRPTQFHFSYPEAGYIAETAIPSAAPDTIQPTDGTASHPSQVFVLDMNGDGHDDLLSLNAHDEFEVKLGPGFTDKRTLHGEKFGGFKPQHKDVHLQNTAPERTFGFVIDYDMDGRHDFLINTYNFGASKFWEFTNDRVFGTKVVNPNWTLLRLNEQGQLEWVDTEKRRVNGPEVPPDIGPIQNRCSDPNLDALALGVCKQAEVSDGWYGNIYVQPGGTHLVDLNDDGALDVIDIDTNFEAGDTRVKWVYYLNTASGFTAPREIVELRGAPISMPMHTIDVEGDGSFELLMYPCFDQYRDTSSASSNTYPTPNGVSTTDYLPDICDTNGSDQFLIVDLDINPSDGSYIWSSEEVPALGYSESFETIISTDLNQDGISDLVIGEHGITASPGPNTLNVVYGTGQGFAAKQALPVNDQDAFSGTPTYRRSEFSRAIVTDANDDGYPDILVPRDYSVRGEPQPPAGDPKAMYTLLEYDPASGELTARVSEIEQTQDTEAQTVSVDRTGSGNRDILQLENGTINRRRTPSGGIYRGLQPDAPRPHLLLGVSEGRFESIYPEPTPNPPPNSGLTRVPNLTIHYRPMVVSSISDAYQDSSVIYVHRPDATDFHVLPATGGRSLVDYVIENEISEPRHSSWADWKNTAYRYYGGYYDVSGRRFLGFTRIESIETYDVQNAETFLRERRTSKQLRYFDPTFFDTSANDFPLAYYPNLIVDFGLEDIPVNWRLSTSRVTRNTWQTRVDGERYFTYLAESTTEHFDAVGAPQIDVFRAFDAGYFEPSNLASAWPGPYRRERSEIVRVDAYGNVEESFAEQQAIGVDAQAHETTIVRTYDQDVPSWLIGRPDVVTVTDSSASSTAGAKQRRYNYDYKSGTHEVEKLTIGLPSDAAHRIIDFEFDAFGNVERSTTKDPSGAILRQQTAVYDDLGQFPHALSNGLGHTTRMVHDPATGEVLTTVGPNGAQTWFAYDTLGTLRRTTGPGGEEAHLWLSRETFRTHVVNAVHRRENDGAESIRIVDAFQRPVREVSLGLRGRVDAVDIEYYGWGAVRRRSEPYELVAGASPSYWTFDEFDADLRRVRSTAPDMRRQVWTYTGNEILSVDFGLKETTQIFDGRGRLSATRDHIGEVVEYGYDAFDELENIDAYGRATSATYDNYGRRLTITDPNIGLTSFDYDRIGQVERRTDANRTVIEYCYDLEGRLIREVRPNGEYSEFQYDQSPEGVGSMTAAISSEGLELGFVYDFAGRLQTTQYTTDFQGSPTTFEVESLRNAVGQVEKLIFPEVPGYGRPELQYGYDNFGHNTVVLDSTQAVLWRWLDADARGSIERDEFGNGAVREQTFEPELGHLSTVVVQNAIGQTIQSLSYQWTDRRSVESETYALRGDVETYGYDDLNRLASFHPMESSANGFMYDPDGRISFKTLRLPGEPDPTGRVLKYDDPKHPSAVTDVMDGPVSIVSYQYDDVGNQRQATGALQRDVGFTAFNQPRNVTMGSGSSYDFAYDAFHNRFKKIVGQVQKYYFGENVEVIDSPSSSVYRMLVSSPVGPLAQVEYEVPAGGGSVSTTWKYFFTDVAGSPNIITDAVGAVLEERSYTPFGQRRNPNRAVSPAQPTAPAEDLMVGFSGHEDEEELGLVNMGGRAYDPMIGRFISADPFQAGIDDGQRLDPYTYVRNDPRTRTDPTGFTDVVIPPPDRPSGRPQGVPEGYVGYGYYPGAQAGDLIVTSNGQWFELVAIGDGNFLAKPFPMAELVRGGSEGLSRTIEKAATSVAGAYNSYKAFANEVNEGVKEVATSVGDYVHDKLGSAYGFGDAAAAAAATAVEVFGGIVTSPISIGLAPEQLLNTPDRVWTAANGVRNARNGYELAHHGSALLGEVSAGILAVAGFKVARGAMRGPSRPGGGRPGGGGVAPNPCRSGCVDPCFMAGTAVATALGAVPIEEVRVGDRVQTIQEESTSIDANARWYKAGLVLAKEDNPEHLFEIELLRTQPEMQILGATETGDRVWLELSELEVRGWATVESLIEVAPPAKGDGRLVTMTLSHLNFDVYEISFVEGHETLRPTGQHPLFSIDRGDWVRVRDLQVGERLQTASGAVTVAALERVRGLHKVFNLEVEGDHEYLVGKEKLRAHNSCRNGRTVTGQSQGREFRTDWLEVNEFDLNQPKHVRGWLRNERRRIESGNGGSSPRNPPGYVQAHGRTTPAREGFDYSNSRLQLGELNKLEESVRRRQGVP